MPSMLIAALLLFARLLAPVAAMPSPAETINQIVLQSLCHDAPAGEHAPGSAHHDCMLCPACHVFAQVAIPAPSGPPLRLPSVAPIGRAAPLPDATGPPARPRVAAQPTGPPASQA